jgi:hypothetical protein
MIFYDFDLWIGKNVVLILWKFYDYFMMFFMAHFMIFLSFFSAHVALKKHKKIIKFSLKKSHMFHFKKNHKIVIKK